MSGIRNYVPQHKIKKLGEAYTSCELYKQQNPQIIVQGKVNNQKQFLPHVKFGGDIINENENKDRNTALNPTILEKNTLYVLTSRRSQLKQFGARIRNHFSSRTSV